MALSVAQYEEIARLLSHVPILVDQMEARRTDFVDRVLQWLKEIEKTLQSIRIPAVSQISSCRATLVSAIRGVQPQDITLVGRPSPRKIREAAASKILRTASDILNAMLMERQTVFQEAERIALQIMTVASVKGIVQLCIEGRSHRDALNCLQQKVANDSDLVNAYSHLAGLVGRTDVLVFIDRALAKI